MKYKMIAKIFLIFAGLWISLLNTPLLAQEALSVSVEGSVWDEDGNPLAGVLISSGNKKNHQLTDINGEYSMMINDGSSFLTFELVGYKTENMSLSKAQGKKITMQADVHKKDQLIDLGYATQSRNSLTGAVATVSGKDLEKMPVSNLAQALSGSMTGLFSLGGNAELGNNGVESLIRGASTLSGRSPLIMIDGIICPSVDYSCITPAEIESVTILKDASVTALYGIQGADGVISIKTKRGHNGKLKVSVRMDQSFQQMTKQPEFLGSAEYAEMRNLAGINDGLGEYSQFSQHQIDMYRSGEDPEHYPNNNWYDRYVKSLTSMQRVGVNVSGGNDVIQYFSDVNFMHQDMPFKTEKNDKYNPAPNKYLVNFRNNIDVKVGKYLKGFINLSGNIRSEKGLWRGLGGIYSDIFSLPPTMAGPLTPEVTDPETGVVSGGQVVTTQREYNPVYGSLNRSGYTQLLSTNIVAQAGLNLDLVFVIPGLSAKGVMAYQTNAYNLTYTIQEYEKWIRDENATNDLVFTKKGSSENKPLWYDKGRNFFYNLSFFGQMDYSRKFGKHSVDAMAYAFYLAQETASWASEAGMLPYKRQSLGLTARYGYKDTYFVKFDVGYSGSDQFHRDHRFIATPAISAAWVISNENFVKDLTWLSNLKLRASYGKSANDQLGDRRFLYLDDFRASNGYDGLRGNEKLHAETIKIQNYGIDLGLFNELSLSVDYFRNRTDDMLLSGGGMAPEYQGVALGNYAYLNKGKMENKGYEIALNYQKKINKDWTVFAGANFSHASNKVIDALEAEQVEDYAYKYRTTGYQLGQYWGYQIDYSNGNGFFNSEEEIEQSGLTYSSLSAPRPGDFIYKDLNGDKVIDEKDQAPIGESGIPKTFYSFSGGFTYKDFEFNFMFQGATGASIYVGGLGYNESLQDGYFSDIHLKSWTKERYENGEEITFPALSLSTSSNHTANSFSIWDRSYLRLKNVEIAYNLPLAKWGVKGLEKARIALRGHNLLTFDKMKSDYIDPEIGLINAFQPYRVYSIGVNLVF